MKHQAVNGRYCKGHGHVPSSLAAYLSICTLTLPRPPVISDSLDDVAALVDKNTVAHNGMVHEPVSIFLPSLQNITSVSVCWDGPNQFNAKQHSFQISSNGPVMNQRFGRKSSPQLSIYLA